MAKNIMGKSILDDKDESYFLEGIHLSKVRESFGGVNAFDSYIFQESVRGLFEMGWGEDEVAEAVNNEFKPESGAKWMLP